MMLSEFEFLPIYRADLAGSRTLSFTFTWQQNVTLHKNIIAKQYKYL